MYHVAELSAFSELVPALSEQDRAVVVEGEMKQQSRELNAGPQGS